MQTLSEEPLCLCVTRPKTCRQIDVTFLMYKSLPIIIYSN